MPMDTFLETFLYIHNKVIEKPEFVIIICLINMCFIILPIYSLVVIFIIFW